MNRTKIEYVDYTYNPVKGLCPGVYAECAEYCYARKLYKRYGWDQTIRLDEAELNCRMPKKPSRIFVGSTFDYSFIDKDILLQIRNRIKENPQHIFIFLTKNPVLYDSFVFPSNCWLGMTVYGASRGKLNKEEIPEDLQEKFRFRGFKKLQVPNLKFISFEPLLRDALGDEDLKGISWVIIGARTSPNIQPNMEWVGKIILQAKYDKCKLFIKNNIERWVKLQQIPEA
jgi:protein gp37